MTPFSCPVRHGVLHGLVHGAPGRPLILALHGWLDNAASFSLLPALLDDYCVVAVDLPGHGHSDWLPPGADYLIWSAVGPLLDLLEDSPVLQGRPVHLLGHSMGTAAAMLLAAAAPERVLSLTLLDALGPLTTAAADAGEQFRSAWRGRSRAAAPVYADVAAAVAARLRAAPDITPGCLEAVVQRNLQSSEGGWRWRTDPRLRQPSAVRFTEEQFHAIMQTLPMPALAIRAEQGLLPRAFYQQRLASLPQGRLLELPGHHHFHLEPSTAPALATAIAEFLAHV